MLAVGVAGQVLEATGKPSRAGASRAKGRGGAAARGSTRVFKAGGARVAVTFPRKNVRDEDLLAALEDAAGQVRASMAGKVPA